MPWKRSASRRSRLPFTIADRTSTRCSLPGRIAVMQCLSRSLLIVPLRGIVWRYWWWCDWVVGRQVTAVSPPLPLQVGKMSEETEPMCRE